MREWISRVPANVLQQQQRQQQLENSSAQKTGQLRGQNQPHADAITDDTSYDRDHDESDSRNRPQSRASQHSTLNESSNGRHGSDTGMNNNRSHPPQISAFQYQQSQFDEPGRTGDDDMW